ncbi:hypothetical protein V1478_014300 [Vespula squamosa]|uniref:Uncharacterized protein n=1 Tax=Vespula squamosa TaxID=30214 RepID=A0ABD2A7L8_VESSQ
MTYKHAAKLQELVPENITSKKYYAKSNVLAAASVSSAEAFELLSTGCNVSDLPFVRHYMLDRTPNEGTKKENIYGETVPWFKVTPPFDFLERNQAAAFGRGAKPMKRRMVRSGKWKGAEEGGKSGSATILENYSTRLEGLWLGNDIEHTDNIHS